MQIQGGLLIAREIWLGGNEVRAVEYVFAPGAFGVGGDEETEALVMIGEIGGSAEEEAAEARKLPPFEITY